MPTESTPEPDDHSPALEAQLLEMSAIAGGLAHEIRNPLSTLKVNLQLLDEDWKRLESNETRDVGEVADVVRRGRKRLATLLAESQRLELILEDFLKYVGRHAPALERHDLCGVVLELADFYRPQAEANNIDFVVRIADRPLPCMLDPGMFKAALLNLLVNAQQAMPNSGTLTFAVGVENDGRARIDVIDTGAGIPVESLSRIFQAYYSTKKGGTGLGLAETRRTILSHGGHIEAEAEPGRGSRFTIHLPTVPPEATTDAVPNGASGSASNGATDGATR